jgi:glycine betaine/proline transport system substrate-binding protein
MAWQKESSLTRINSKFINGNSSIRFYTFFILPIFIFSATISCESEKAETSENYRPEINIAYANWAEGVAISNLAVVILEDELGYKVVSKMAPVSEVFELVGSGEYDVFADAWLPTTHGLYMEKHQDNIEQVSRVYQNAQTGLVVPDYVDAQSIIDLQNKAGDFNNQIIGIEPTAGIMQSTRNAIDQYELTDLTLIESSGLIMADSLKSAIMRREPIVLTGWVPHWIWAEFNIRFLEDPRQAFGDEENIYVVGNRQFLEEESNAIEFLSRLSLNRVQLSGLMSDIRTSEKLPSAVAREWVKENPSLVNDWVRGLKPERLRIY